MLNSRLRLHNAVTATAVGSSRSTADTMHRMIPTDRTLDAVRSTSDVPNTVP